MKKGIKIILNITIILAVAISLAILNLGKVKALSNNKFGIHILETNEVKKAAELVNSSGGDWGYVTIVMREDDLNYHKWQKFMDNCRRLHLIPIIRIATKMDQAGFWLKPKLDDLEKWPLFLNSLNWPVKKQIVVIFNEPNQSKEWGGEINPAEYALVLEKSIKLLKQANPNFFVLNAGLDQAADARNGTIKEEVFLRKMFETNNNIFNYLDGWASHSYPNHGFRGLPSDVGRATIKGYQWELKILKNLSLTKNLPVYITETGWPHREGKIPELTFYQSNKTAQLFKKAFEYWMTDNRLKSVTPFILNYNELPFDHFSWLKKDGTHYPQFNQILSFSKKKGAPEQIKKYQLVDLQLADLLPTNYTYHGKIKIKNTGQWIMGERNNLNLIFEKDMREFRGSLRKQPRRFLEGIFPGQEKEFDFSFKTGSQSGERNFKLGGKNYTIYIYKPFEWNNKKVSLWRQLLNRLKLWWLDFRER